MTHLEPITQREFEKIRDLLVSVCGIDLKPDQNYLVETRLTELATEVGVKNFSELHRAIVADPELLPRVVDLMTTNETLWFRDDSCWRTLEQALVPALMEKVRLGKRVRVWSAASSTGQEAYSFAMLTDEMFKAAGLESRLDQIEIIGTDISQAALYLAQKARYDSFTMHRGLSEARTARYFTHEGNFFELRPEIRQRVKFLRYNLMDSFAPLGQFDLVFCRNVAIYFSVAFKEELFEKVAQALVPEGVMLLGATESLFGLKHRFTNLALGNGLYYRVTNSHG